MTDNSINVAEKMAIEGIQIEFNGIKAKFDKEMERIAMRDRLICDVIAERLGLPANAIGTTHRIVKETWTVELIPVEITQEEVLEVGE